MLSVAALVSAQARMGPICAARLAVPEMRARISSSASKVRVLPVPGGPCDDQQMRCNDAGADVHVDTDGMCFMTGLTSSLVESDSMRQEML